MFSEAEIAAYSEAMKAASVEVNRDGNSISLCLGRSIDLEMFESPSTALKMPIQPHDRFKHHPSRSL